MAEWLCSGLQIRVRRFDSGLRLQTNSSRHLLHAQFKELGIACLIGCSLKRVASKKKPTRTFFNAEGQAVLGRFY